MVRSSNIVAAATFLAGVCQAQATGFKSCDALIDAGLGESLLLPASEDDTYTRALGTYYSATVAEMRPFCILQPKTVADVSTAVKALAPLSGAGSWNIAVRGGGHGHWGGNNVHNGVTIDLSLFNKTVLAETEKHGLGVTGGRIGNVGVAGLTLGGGTSFLIAERGFACDDVVNYEVVLADGSTVNANKHDNPRLFKALKGGGSNFGIVTRFDMATFPKKTLYGGIMFIDWKHKDELVDSMIEVISDSEEKPGDSMIVMYTYNAGAAAPMMGTIPMSATGDEDARPFRGMDQMTAVMDMRTRWTYGELLAVMQDNGGKRNSWYTLCFHNDKRIMDKAEELFHTLVADAEKAFPNASWSLNFVFQPLPKVVAKFSGGNALGLQDSLTHDGILFAGEATLNTRAEEAYFSSRLAIITHQLEAYAKSVDGNIPFRYLPYAAPEQDPLSTYGAENIALMKDVALEYDPTGFFQTRVNGGFKLDNVA
ncbi:FAD binding domain-containing protein [Verticillium alfalfae VaMs.102]|uniref:FAD binding domain-containing protein n=1 Tax=Verticillium alfalfae (strain VaMs.102 / ATCC MYA-4576 / FGSC 10136) TaxID=526221 RepID=C9SCQ4_VERA1|nr:FAD binding domain-containing protein [Verticillium alfalfae VaMs.102]EEY16869.1 FAD binding domain-containing protein [Verticillium alfalfae VaMs.102]